MIIKVKQMMDQEKMFEWKNLTHFFKWEGMQRKFQGAKDDDLKLMQESAAYRDERIRDSEGWRNKKHYLLFQDYLRVRNRLECIMEWGIFSIKSMIKHLSKAIE